MTTTPLSRFFEVLLDDGLALGMDGGAGRFDPRRRVFSPELIYFSADVVVDALPPLIVVQLEANVAKYAVNRSLLLEQLPKAGFTGWRWPTAL